MFSGGGVGSAFRLGATYPSVKDRDRFNQDVRLLYLACGNEDPSLDGMNNLHRSLERLGTSGPCAPAGGQIRLVTRSGGKEFHGGV